MTAFAFFFRSRGDADGQAGRAALGVSAHPRIVFDYDTAPTRLLALSNISDRPLQHLVLASPDSCEGRPYLDVGNQSDPLELTAIGVPHVMAGEPDYDTSGKCQIGDVAIGARRAATDKTRTTGGLQKQA